MPNPNCLGIVISIEGNLPTNKKFKIEKINKVKATENQLITLKHGQTVRGAGFPVYAQRISVGTARGYSAEYNENQEEAHQRAISNGHATAWTNQDAACLTADYPGKAEAHAAHLKEIAEAVELHNGQKVEIEGEIFAVRLVGSHVSDPIHFIRA